MKIGFKETDSKEYRCITMAMYSFIAFMIFFALCRLCGWFWFSVEYKSIEVSKWVFWLIMGIYKTVEGVIILKILTVIKWYYCLLISIIYTCLNFSINESVIQFGLDIVFTFSIPFIFNRDKTKSILSSLILFLIICIYQAFMMIGRYNLSINGKYDLFYAICSTIDYKLYLLIIMLYSIKRRDKNA